MYKVRGEWCTSNNAYEPTHFMYNWQFLPKTQRFSIHDLSSVVLLCVYFSLPHPLNHVFIKSFVLVKAFAYPCTLIFIV